MNISKTATITEKNLMALIFLLAGLLIGSLFVDVAQLFTGSGFSGKVARTHNVLEGKEKTWVAYTDPMVALDVVTDKNCDACSADEALIWLRRVMPTLSVREIDAESQAGQALIKRFAMPTLPAMVFSESIAKTDFYAQASSLFTEDNGKFYLRMSELGLPAGKYLSVPEIEETDIVIGRRDAPVRITEYSDFQCPFCREYHANLIAAVRESEHSDDIAYVFKNMPLAVHDQSLNAALSSECAHDQAKFAVYSDLLFAKQEEWAATSGTKKFRDYAAQLKLNVPAFSACMESQKHVAKLQSVREEADSLGLTGTPATFVNDIFLKGAVTKEVIAETVKQALAR